MAVEQDKAAAAAAECDRMLATADAETQAARAAVAEKDRELSELKGRLTGADSCLTCK